MCETRSLRCRARSSSARCRSRQARTWCDGPAHRSAWQCDTSDGIAWRWPAHAACRRRPCARSRGCGSDRSRDVSPRPGSHGCSGKEASVGICAGSRLCGAMAAEREHAGGAENQGTRMVPVPLSLSATIEPPSSRRRASQDVRCISRGLVLLGLPCLLTLSAACERPMTAQCRSVKGRMPADVIWM